MKSLISQIFALLVALVLTSIAHAEIFTFALPDKDGRIMEIVTPERWSASRTSDMTISVDHQGGERMSFLITAAVPAIRSPMTALDIAQDQAAQFSAGSEIPTLPVTVIEEKGLVGAYFDAVDKALKPGGFKYLRHFTIELDGVMVFATVLSNAGHRAINAKALDIIKAIRIVEVIEI